MQQLQKAQEKLNKITVSFVAINCLVGKLTDSDNTISGVTDQLTKIGASLDEVTKDIVEVADLIVASAPHILRKIIQEDRFE